MVERAVLLIFLGGMVFRVGVLPWNYGRTGGSTNFWGRNVFKVGGFIDGILVVRAVVLICGGEMFFLERADVPWKMQNKVIECVLSDQFWH